MQSWWRRVSASWMRQEDHKDGVRGPQLGEGSAPSGVVWVDRPLLLRILSVKVSQVRVQRLSAKCGVSSCPTPRSVCGPGDRVAGVGRQDRASRWESVAPAVCALGMTPGLFVRRPAADGSSTDGRPARRRDRGSHTASWCDWPPGRPINLPLGWHIAAA